MSRLYTSNQAIRPNRMKLFVLSAIVLLSLFALPVWAQIYGSKDNPIDAGSFYSGGYWEFWDNQNNDSYSGFGNTIGNYSDDVWYRFTVTNLTQINISLCGSNFNTYLHLLDENGNELESNDDNGPLCAGTQSSIQTTLSPGVYFAVAEGINYNSGNIVMEISNTVVDASLDAAFGTAIDAGNFSSCGSRTFMDYQNNSTSNGFGNKFGQPSDDIFYRLTISKTTPVNISLCGSNFDTYLHLLDEIGNEIESNDDNGPMCIGVQSSIQRTLSPGVYYVVAEGFDVNSGDIVLEISNPSNGSFPEGATLATAIDAGTLAISFTDTKNNSLEGCYQNLLGNPSNEIYYKFTLTRNTEVSISHCGTAIDTYMYLLDNSGAVIATNDDNGPLCTGSQASIKTTLSAGIYYVVSEGYGTTSGDITTSITAATQNGGIIPGQIVYSTQVVNPETRILEVSYSVGTTQGALSVSPYGNSSYTIPLELPDGRGELMPSLAMVYSNQSGSGPAGYGWNISGLSSISRGSRNYYNDSIFMGVNLDGYDRFMLDGQRLLCTFGKYGEANAQYHTENDIFTRVTSLGSCGIGPEKFKAESKSGLVYEFGYSTDAAQKFQGFTEVVNWYVNKISDCYGNQITFYYQNDNGVVYPTQINYGSNRILFFYKERTDKTDAYFKGIKTTQKLLLDKIEIYYGETIIKKYAFIYTYPNDLYNGYSLLNEIIEYGSSGNRFNSTAFSYTSTSEVNFVQTKYNQYHNNISYQSKLCTGDFNGDGKSDFVCIPDPSKGAIYTGIWVFTDNGTDNFSIGMAIQNISIDVNKLKDIQAMDINSDGRDDLLYELDDNGTSSFYYMLSHGSYFSNPVLIQNQTYGVYVGLGGKESYKQENDGRITNADFDGDGINDILLTDNYGMWRILSFGNSSGQLTQSLSLKASGSNMRFTSPVFSADFNGDGKAEIWNINIFGTDIYTLNGSTLELLYHSPFPNSSNYYRLGDFNGDGKTDLFVYYDELHPTNFDLFWQVCISTGNGFITQYIPKKKENLKNDNVRTGDFNGDGCTDLMVYSKDDSFFGPFWSGTYFYISKNKGTDFYTHSLPSYPVSQCNYYIGDYNGDGKSEFICTAGTTDLWNGYKVFKSEGNSSILMDKVSNGFNQLTKIEYAKLSQPNNSVYLKENNAVFPVFDYQGPYTVVSSVNLDNGLGGLNTINYKYEGAKIHRQGKGFLCFSKSTTMNSTEGTEMESNYDYNQTYFFSRLNTISKKLTIGSSVYETNTNNWTQKILDSEQKRILPYIESNTKTNLLTGDTVRSSAIIDDYGNPIQVTKSFNGGRTETVINNYLNIISPSDWQIGKLDQSTVTYTKSGETPISRTKSYTYSTDGILKPDFVHYLSGTNFYTYQDNDYDSYGNLIHVVEHNSNGDTIASSYIYDSEGKNIVSDTDPLGHTTTYSYISLGRLASQQDYLGNSASFEYDDFGRQTSENRPDGSQTNTSYIWDETNKPSLAAYGVKKTSNNGAISIVWYDKLGRGIRSVSNGFDGTMILGDTKYNNKGQVDQSSEPYFTGGTPVSTTNYYDSYGRVSSILRPTGMNTTYSYTNNTVSETTAGKTYSKTYASDGSIISATDNGGAINYTYFADGKVNTITSPDTLVTSMQYDIVGNQTQLNDPSAGIINYTYDGFGQLLTQTDAKNQQTIISYLPDGRVNSKINPEGTYAYAYNSNKQLSGVTSPSSILRSYDYDNTGRMISSTETIQGSPFTSSFTFDNHGRIATHVFPSGIVETNTYNANGYLSSIAAGGSTRYTITGMNARQQLTAATYGANLQGAHDYDTYGFPTTISTGSIRSYTYSFDALTGNLNWRKNVLHDIIQENFEYDNLDRLSRIYQGGTTMLNMAYSSNGNITTKSDIGTSFGYNNLSKPYAITNISTSSGIIPQVSQTVGYNSFEKIISITEGQFNANFVYNEDNERCKMEMLQNGTSVLTRWYTGGNYIKELTGSTVKEYSFIGGDAYTAPVVAVKVGTAISWYYLLRDNLGSITHVVDSLNNASEYSYDAWGRRRNPANWSYDLTGQPDLFAGRGFTGHETMTEFGLINMNGRLYDPNVGRFLSPDPYVQAPDFTQNLNRYSYGLNNPLKYNDPSGKFIFLAALAGGIINWIANGAEFNWKGLGSFANGAISGFAGGAGGAWSSTASQALGALPGALAGGISGALAGGLSGGLVSGLYNTLSGGDFSKGFWAGAKSGAISGGLSGAMSGGINGYNLAKEGGADPWTGYKIVGDSRPYCASGFGNPADYKQKFETRDCAAYNRGFSTKTKPESYFQYEAEDGGADMKQLLIASRAKGIQSGWSSDEIWDNAGMNMKNGAGLYSTSGAHVYTIVGFTVSDKANLFFGGTHQVLSEVEVFNSLTGALQPGSGFLHRITWGY